MFQTCRSKSKDFLFQISSRNSAIYDTLNWIDPITTRLKKYDGQDNEGMFTRYEKAKIRLRRLASFKSTLESEIEIEDATKI